MIRLHLVALCFLGLVSTSPARAGSISFVPLTITTVNPGGSVTFEIYGSSVNDIGAFSLKLNTDGTGDQFQLTSYTINTALFEDFAFDPPLPESLSTTHDSQELGSFSNDSTPLLANTSYLLATATIGVDASTPDGVYGLGNTANTVFTDPSFTMSDFAPISMLQITISSIPEPSTWGALMTGVLTCLIFARRRRRARAATASEICPS